MGLFSKTPKPISENERLLKEIITKNTEIKYMTEKYDDFILQSVILDYEKFKDHFDKNQIDTRSQKEFWHITHVGYQEITLSKKDAKLSIKYTFELGNEDFAIKSMSLNGPISIGIVHANKFTSVVSQYFYYFKLREIKEEHERKSSDFQKMVGLIGKDVHRDALIEQILSKNDR